MTFREDIARDVRRALDDLGSAVYGLEEIESKLEDMDDNLSRDPDLLFILDEIAAPGPHDSLQQRAWDLKWRLK